TLAVAAEPTVVTATGYGRVEAARSWVAVSEVEGRVTEVFEGLSIGSIVEAGDLLVQVDRTDYELAVQKAKANLASAEASLAELAQQEANSSRLMELENRILEVAEAEFARTQDLQSRGTSTQASLDTAQRTLLAQQSSVTNLQNTIDLYPAQRASLEATVAVRRAELEEAERALENTTIRAPFRGRVSQEAVEESQFIRVGGELLSLDSIEAVEVVAAFQPRDFAPVAQITLGPRFSEIEEVDATRAIEFLTEAGVSATVRLQLAGVDAVYPAELVRLRGTIDDTTGTIGIAVRVLNPMVATGITRRPPLNVGGFVAVDIKTEPIGGLITIPRETVRQSDTGAPFVFLADPDDRLEIRPITLGPVVQNRVIVRSGLGEGDALVLSDPQPPLEGLKLLPVAEGGDT
ncbi:MAG: efflux RND transporter periplasmic adaptor subunit, partial [Pseudomonadota bacterium]